MRIPFFQNRKKYQDIHPDEIFVDSKNLPDFDTHQFEGRLEKPISKLTFFSFGLVCLIIGLTFIARASNLQILNGKVYADKSENNSLQHNVIFASRGIISDRNGVDLAWNQAPDSEGDFPKRTYATSTGFGNLLGFLKYPAKDSSGFFYRENYDPQQGLELSLNDLLSGKNGLKITETDVAGSVVSQSLIDNPVDGQKATLSVDSRIQAKLYEQIAALSGQVGFQGGAGVIMDINSGEILALVSYPEYSSQVMTDGTPAETISGYSNDGNMPFLDRAVAGLYAPGSIVKPVMALAALQEGVITADKEIVTNGKLVIPNPYDPSNPSIFLDWRNNGVLDMRHAIQNSSDVYFYEIGGGFGDQPGLGILNIKKYMEKFGYGAPTGLGLNEGEGNLPDPAWKEKTFGEPWRLGDTYHTVIGQYGTLVTPIQVARAIAAIANDGTLVTPTILKQATTTTPIGSPRGQKILADNGQPISNDYYQVVHEGMRLSVQGGTSVGLNVPYVHLAGKTGTAEIGVKKDLVNSWTAGFFPYENPKYVYAIVMEKGPVHNLIGATYVMRQLLDWMNVNTPEYFTTAGSNQ